MTSALILTRQHQHSYSEAPGKVIANLSKFNFKPYSLGLMPGAIVSFGKNIRYGTVQSVGENKFKVKWDDGEICRYDDFHLQPTLVEIIPFCWAMSSVVELPKKTIIQTESEIIQFPNAESFLVTAIGEDSITIRNTAYHLKFPLSLFSGKVIANGLTVENYHFQLKSQEYKLKQQRLLDSDQESRDRRLNINRVLSSLDFDLLSLDLINNLSQELGLSVPKILSWIESEIQYRGVKGVEVGDFILIQKEIVGKVKKIKVSLGKDGLLTITAEAIEFGTKNKEPVSVFPESVRKLELIEQSETVYYLQDPQSLDFVVGVIGFSQKQVAETWLLPLKRIFRDYLTLNSIRGCTVSGHNWEYLVPKFRVKTLAAKLKRIKIAVQINYNQIPRKSYNPLKDANLAADRD
jgi:hypothetical protein